MAIQNTNQSFRAVGEESHANQISHSEPTGNESHANPTSHSEGIARRISNKPHSHKKRKYIYTFNKNIKYNTNAMETLKILYQNFISMKKYFWTHYLMSIGWIIFISSICCIAIYDNIDYVTLLLISLCTITTLIIFGIPFIFIIIADKISIESTCINLNFLNKNPIYHLIWQCGIVLILVESLIFCYTSIYTIFHIIDYSNFTIGITIK